MLRSKFFGKLVSHDDIHRQQCSANDVPPRAQGDAPVKVVRCRYTVMLTLQRFDNLLETRDIHYLDMPAASC